MADKRGDFASRAAGALAALVAGFAARKVVGVAWKRILGKEPPDPEDPAVGLGEAVGWSAVMAVVAGTARLLATRMATKRMQAQAADEAEPD